MALRDFLRNNWPAVTITVTAVAIVIAAVVLLRSMPPRMIVMATGSEGGTFYDVGERYRAALERAGVEVRLVHTAGSAENLALLLDPHSGVSVGLIQGGTIGAAASSNKLESLGTVFFEPLWLFYKPELGNNKGHIDLRGRRISVGPVGSGTRALSLELLKRNGIDGQNSELLALTTKESEEKLLAGEIDALGTVNVCPWALLPQGLSQRVTFGSRRSRRKRRNAPCRCSSRLLPALPSPPLHDQPPAPMFILVYLKRLGRLSHGVYDQ